MLMECFRNTTPNFLRQSAKPVQLPEFQHCQLFLCFCSVISLHLSFNFPYTFTMMNFIYQFFLSIYLIYPSDIFLLSIYGQTLSQILGKQAPQDTYTGVVAHLVKYTVKHTHYMHKDCGSGLCSPPVGVVGGFTSSDTDLQVFLFLLYLFCPSQFLLACGSCGFIMLTLNP